MNESTNVHELNDFAQAVGARLRVARENAGLTQQQLARRLGVEAASVSAWESNERQPRANRLAMLCGMLDVSLKWLLEGREDARMAREDDTLSVMRAELEQLKLVVHEASNLVAALGARLEALETTQDAPRRNRGFG